MNERQPDSPPEPPQLAPAAVCAECGECGAHGSIPFDGIELCSECYAAKGSCCAGDELMEECEQ
jgi:hypothetical protein